MKRLVCLTLALLLAWGLAGCGKQEDPFRVLFAAPYVNRELTEQYVETLDIPEEVICEDFSFGSDEVDGVTYGASAMMMTAMMAAGEVDVLVCDLGEAARYARSECFFDPTTIFTGEELEEFPDRLVSFDMVDQEGNPTGEKTAPCGLNLSDREELCLLAGSESVGIFIVRNTADLELAKAIFWEIVNG